MYIAHEGLPFIIGFGLLGLGCVFVPNAAVRAVGIVLLILGSFCLYFFRDPERVISPDPRVIICPADGRVLEVTEEDSPYFQGKVQVVKIFMSIFNVHIQRSPIQGRVEKIEYQEGKFLDTRDLRASFENENNSIVVRNQTTQIVVKQIAGLIARRIVCRVREGQSVSKGERLGLIRFGSQVDIFLPLNTNVTVKKGDRVFGGLTPIGLLNGIPATGRKIQQR